MSSPIISDDDESFDQIPEELMSQDVITLSSDDEPNQSDAETEEYAISDESIDFPTVQISSDRKNALKRLFPNSKSHVNSQQIPSTSSLPCLPKAPGFEKMIGGVKVDSQQIPSTSSLPCLPKAPGFEKMIGGVKVHLPVNPYGSQLALMAKVITAKGQNCLLESPTGSGKTLALLCSALAWQQHEQNRFGQTQVQNYFSDFPQLREVDGVHDYIATPPNVTPEKFFTRTTFGEKSIYDKPVQNGSGDASTSDSKRQQCFKDAEESKSDLVKIHKKRRLNNQAEFNEKINSTSPKSPSTPERSHSPPEVHTPQKVSLPTIYYGARTHKQIQQVIKEFKRTSYVGEAPMTILSSREHSCIRECDKNQWSSKNDMCRECIKPASGPDKQKGESNCKYYDNRAALNRDTLPPAFDLEDLVLAGEEKIACPHYAAREMASTANIVFCPYNYLIEPGIRSSMQIDVTDQIIILDEAHNIEDMCRSAATLTISRDEIQMLLKELDTVAGYRYTNQEVSGSIGYLLKAFKNWDDWFAHQLPLMNNRPVYNDEAVYTWEVEHFVQTLNNHNIGQPHYIDFSVNSKLFCSRYRDDPRTLKGITQSTSSLIESIDTVFGYLFRDSGKYMDDYKPALVRTVVGEPGDGMSWRNRKWAPKETLSLRLVCMNSAVVFEALKPAKCIILASGTLTPTISLHSELACDFPLQVSPNHIIPKDRVWVGTLTTYPDGRPLQCTSRYTEQVDTQDALGQTVLWVCQVTPHGVLCFLPSYQLMYKLIKRWRDTGLWKQLGELKHVFQESRGVKDHNDVMEDYYKYVKNDKGAILFAVYRGKVSEGMDFKDHQARAVITIGIPYPNTFDMAVTEKIKYNDKYAASRGLLPGREWLRVQAYRALNQAVGRCVRHSGDWGAVLLVDARLTQSYYTEHLSKWVRNFLGNNHHSFDSLVNSPNSLESFMQNMTIKENEEM